MTGLIVNVILKKVIKQPRPDGTELEDEGMPSNHAQFLGYFVTFYICELVFRSKRLDIFYRFVYSCAGICHMILVAYSRVYLNYHTFDQVLCGCLVGIIYACFWYFLKMKYLDPVGIWLCKSKLFQWLCIRDYSHFGYVSVDEYVCVCGRSNNHHIYKKS